MFKRKTLERKSKSEDMQPWTHTPRWQQLAGTEEGRPPAALQFGTVLPSSCFTPACLMHLNE